jgi:Zn-dependent peptidase ImmA (M78 family)
VTIKAQIARQGLSKAMEVRQQTRLKPWQAVCIFDLAEKLGAEVRFDDIDSMEGAHEQHSSLIQVPVHRPFGRKAFSCAHELGHQVFGHGTCIDDLMEFSGREFKPVEFLVDCFAGFLLMPKLAVSHGFARRGWSPATCTPEQAFVVAGWLGVGYETLVKHMQHSLKMIRADQAAALRRDSPLSIRTNLLGHRLQEDLFIVDQHWTDRAAVLRVDDLLACPPGCRSEGKCIEVAQHPGTRTLLRAARSGLGRVASQDGSWAAYVRVSKRDFVGWNAYRHEEDPDDD